MRAPFGYSCFTIGNTETINLGNFYYSNVGILQVLIIFIKKRIKLFNFFLLKNKGDKQIQYTKNQKL